MTDTPKRPRGRPVKFPLPEPIPDSPENVLRSLVTAPRKREEDWKYLKDGEPE